MRYCKKCQMDKPLSSFGKDKYGPDGLTYFCKECRNAQSRDYGKANGAYKKRNAKYKEYRKEYYSRNEVWRRTKNQQLLSSYGITIQEFEKLSLLQNNLCAICFKPQISKRNKVLAVDYCHKTGKIRGLLCEKCNRAIGLLGDDINVLLLAIKYLEKEL